MAGGFGGGFDADGEPGLNAEINITPLVDVALVLLIIFMIAAPMMTGGVDVQLPRAQAKPLPNREGLTVVVERDGRLRIENDVVTYGEFRGTFAALVQTRKPEAVYLRADRRALYGDVVRALAVIRGAGVRSVGLVAEDEGTRP